MLPGNKGFANFQKIFSKKYINKNGFINRELLKTDVFQDNDLKKQLEAILHPLVRAELNFRCKQEALLGKNLIAEVPLLFESGFEDGFDFIVAVFVPKKICNQRIISRDGLTDEFIRQIIDSQMPVEEKCLRSHFVVDNGGTYASTVGQAVWIIKTMVNSHF